MQKAFESCQALGVQFHHGGTPNLEILNSKPETLNKSKQGFAVPVAKWLKTELKSLAAEAFDKKKIEREGIFEYSYIKNVMDGFMADKNDTRKEIWSLFMFEMWYNKWM